MKNDDSLGSGFDRGFGSPSDRGGLGNSSHKGSSGKDRIDSFSQSINSPSMNSNLGNSRPRPWIRYWARMIDMGLFSWMFIFYWPFEAFLLSTCGGTPGKWLLGVQVTKSDGRRPSFQEAWGRAWRVWVKGVALSIPIVAPFTMCSSYSCLKNTGSTIWDREGDFIVTHRPVGLVKGFCAIVAMSIIGTVQVGVMCWNMFQNTAVTTNNDGLAAMNKGNYDEAMKDFNSAISSVSTNSTFYSNRGLLYYKLGKYQPSLDDLNKAISLDSSKPIPFENRAATYLKLQKFDLAYNDMETEAKLGGQIGGQLNNLGAQLCDANNYQEALKVLNEAATAKPNDAMIFLNRGFTYNELHQYKEGLSDLSKAITLDPTNSTAYFNRALSYQKLGQMDLARQDVAKGQELKASNALKASSPTKKQ